MKIVPQGLKSRLKGTWIHRLVWAYKNPPAGDRNAYYDHETIEVMFRVLRRSSNCIDVGAHRGAILRFMIDIAPRGRHYAFEPLPHIAPELKEGFPQAIVHQAAVSDQSGESEFLFVKNDPGYSGLRRRMYDRADPDIATIRVRVVTLDEAIPPGEKIAFIKIDVEGGEFHALKGGIEMIRRCKPVIVFEASSRSTGQYGVKSDDLYLLITKTLGYELSTMERWLKRKPRYTQQEFAENWNHGAEFYFLAAPRRETSPR
jgi:FkbM family methyltransferase